MTKDELDKKLGNISPAATAIVGAIAGAASALIAIAMMDKPTRKKVVDSIGEISDQASQAMKNINEVTEDIKQAKDDVEKKLEQFPKNLKSN